MPRLISFSAILVISACALASCANPSSSGAGHDDKKPTAEKKKPKADISPVDPAGGSSQQQTNTKQKIVMFGASVNVPAAPDNTSSTVKVTVNKPNSQLDYGNIVIGPVVTIDSSATLANPVTITWEREEVKPVDLDMATLVRWDPKKQQWDKAPTGLSQQDKSMQDFREVNSSFTARISEPGKWALVSPNIDMMKYVEKRLGYRVPASGLEYKTAAPECPKGAPDWAEKVKESQGYGDSPQFLSCVERSDSADTFTLKVANHRPMAQVLEPSAGMKWVTAKRTKAGTNTDLTDAIYSQLQQKQSGSSIVLAPTEEYAITVAKPTNGSEVDYQVTSHTPHPAVAADMLALAFGWNTTQGNQKAIAKVAEKATQCAINGATSPDNADYSIIPATVTANTGCIESEIATMKTSQQDSGAQQLFSARAQATLASRTSGALHGLFNSYSKSIYGSSLGGTSANVPGQVHIKTSGSGKVSVSKKPTAPKPKKKPAKKLQKATGGATLTPNGFMGHKFPMPEVKMIEARAKLGKEDKRFAGALCDALSGPKRGVYLEWGAFQILGERYPGNPLYMSTWVLYEGKPVPQELNVTFETFLGKTPAELKAGHPVTEHHDWDYSTTYKSKKYELYWEYSKESGKIESVTNTLWACE